MRTDKNQFFIMSQLFKKGLRTGILFLLHRQPAKNLPIRLLLFCALLLFFGKAMAQEVGLPAVVKPSPQSMAFTRYGDYPMTGCNGLTDITIPVHTIAGRKLSLPITMSFHASGMMAGEVEGALGMRWTLNCGGLVTRTMKGTPDEWNYLNPLDINSFIEGNQEVTFDMLYSSCTDGKIHGLITNDISYSHYVELYDSEYDIFNYSLPNGKSGHFILKGAAGSKVAMTIPYDPIKIEFVKASTENGYIESLTITDVDGTKYKFGKIDGSTDNAVESNIEWDIVDNRLGRVSTAWYLTKIISSDNTDEMSLFYNTRSLEYWAPTQTATIRDRIRNYDPWEWPGGGSQGTYLANLQSDLVMWHFDQTDVLNEPKQKDYIPVLSSIQFNGGSVSLNYTSSKSLSNIVINRGSVPYKKVTFTLATQNGGSMHFLNNISFYGEDQTTLAEKYDFSYYDAYSFSPRDLAPIKDWWGYLTGVGGQGLILPQAEQISAIPLGLPYTQNLGGPSIHRDADENAKIGGMLKTITYPTGGLTEFIYENNKYDWAPYYQPGVNSHTLWGPGLRIKEVISTPVKGRVVHKEYKYGIYEDGRGFINDYLRPGSISFAELKVMESNVQHYWTWVQSNGSLGGIDQAGHRSRVFLGDPYISFDLSANNIKYDAVTEYVYESDGSVWDIPVPRQKTQTRYSWGDNAQITPFNVTDQEMSIHYPRKFSNPENAWRTPVMTGKTFYKYENGQYAPIKTETYTYSTDEKDHAWDLPTYLHTSIVYAIVSTGLSGYSGPLDNYLIAKSYHNEWPASVYGWGKRKYATGSQLLLNTTIEEFTPAGTIVTQKDMDYEPDNHFLRSEAITNSKNEQLTTTYSYPRDFAAVSPYNEMLNRHIISPVIEQVQTNTTINKELARNRTNYDLWQGNTIIQPVTIQKSILGNALETEATINKYDSKGNILQVTGKDGVITSYVWGYDQKYPVAKIVGRSYDDAVSPQIGLDLAIVNNGAYSDATIRAELNKLRALSNGFVSTYTYKPLTGMTSETDPDGRTIYYEYDVVGRLALTRDKDNNILKKYAYNFQGQCATCGAISNANWQETGNTRPLPCNFNPTYNGMYGQREEKDMNPASLTYNQSRWLDYLIPWGDPLYNVSLYTTYEEAWVNTSTPPRCIQDNGQNTGEQEQEQVYKAANPCSISQNSLRWKNIGTNTNACPLPPLYTSHDLSGTYYSSVCTSPAEPDPIYVPVPLFTSTISVLDADIQAGEWAQRYADEHGTCTVPPITLNFINNTGDGMVVSLYDVITGQEYKLYSVNGSNAYYQNLPQGVYHIYIEPVFNAGWVYYEVGCGFSIESNGEVWLEDIPINAGCNTITAN
jgi:YD repeat-containing protein